MNRRGRPLGRWEDRVKAYVSQRKWVGVGERHVEGMENEEFVKKVYLNSVDGMNRRGRPLGRWKDRLKEYVSVCLCV